MNISDLPQEISILREERLKAENRLIGARKMLPCSSILRKVICGNPNWNADKIGISGWRILVNVTLLHRRRRNLE
ncbi:unnamed protein product [marine sediment metagenome]|jgi:hypothetical protein|uniref:Uncharacterized protein n=1 Tax=marine sediment metagenome TaxID=412755 RepID=X1N443_9ZZZZ|nr:hypothetical protein [Clostridia bacterium]